MYSLCELNKHKNRQVDSIILVFKGLQALQMKGKFKQSGWGHNWVHFAHRL